MTSLTFMGGKLRWAGSRLLGMIQAAFVERGIARILLGVVAGLLLLACMQVQVRGQGGVSPAASDGAKLAQNGNYYALVIGIDDYSPPLPKLATAVGDAKAIAKVLSDNYGFQVKLLIDQDATRNNILKALAQYRNKLNENDNLLIYYAGHGISDRRADKAYWIPVDADSVDSPNRIIADEITTDVRVQSARHVLIISDSCYSGGLTRDAEAPAQSAGQAAFLNRMLTSRSRTLMASGGDEPVSDGGPDGHSVFAYAVLRSLQQTGEAVFTASDLFYGSVRQQVAGRSSQLPQYSIIRNSSHDDGDFVFTRTVASASVAPLKVTAGSELWAKGKALADANRAAEALPLFQQACEAGDARGVHGSRQGVQARRGERRRTCQSRRVSFASPATTAIHGDATCWALLTGRVWAWPRMWISRPSCSGSHATPRTQTAAAILPMPW